MLKTGNFYDGFISGKWQSEIDVADFIKQNYKPYEGDSSFLSDATQRTKRAREKMESLFLQERQKGGVLDIDVDNVSTVVSYEPGYLTDEDIILGFQTDKPLKRGVNPFGGLRMAVDSCKAYGYKVNPKIFEHFKYAATHNDGVFRAYTDEMRALRKYGLITGLPDAYGRGRIIGDYRRVALYGVDRLIEAKKSDMQSLARIRMNDENIRLREEVFCQIESLEQLKIMASSYGCDISKPAMDAKQAVQWTYFAYLASIKESNGAAMSLGRVGTFFDIYFERDMKNGILDETSVQEIMDDFVIKLRMSRQLRTPEYNELFAGDPTWVTESIGGMGIDGRTLVTKTSFRILHTLYNLGASPEPNLTVLWSQSLPEGFKNYCAKVSLDTSSIQYENDDLMRPISGDDYGIACCVSSMKIGKQMQFFGARCNLAKLLLLSINGGREELHDVKIGLQTDAFDKGVLEFDKVYKRYREYIKWLAEVYVDTMNVIHYMHDKYAYEKIMLSLHDTNIERLMAFGVAGLSIVADSLSAIKYAKVYPIVNSNGLVIDYKIEGDYPKYGNDDDRVDSIARDLVEVFYKELTNSPTYRGAKHTLSVLTITSNVVYGQKTGTTPCGRKSGQPFAPGANPYHGRDENGAVASLNSVAKLAYTCCKDGISNTFSVVPSTLGKNNVDRQTNLVSLIDGYFDKKGHHININAYNREDLLKANERPEDYPNLTIRVSGYAVKFAALSKKHREEVLARTFHNKL
ncbi:MAG: formate C-acetyltransferase [Clostridiales bacterium]|jgi:formate C-acetyltransferase|nr:formate C-acetyltransferase [Clostridiales bacterium]